MHPITIILGVVAAVLFIVEAIGRPSAPALVPWGLFFLTLTLMAAFLLTGEDVIHLID